MPARRLGGAAGQARGGERDARPGAHGLHRGRADDRHRARDVRRRARAGPARVEQRRDRAADPGRPRRDVAGRLHRVPGGGRRRGRGARRHGARQQRAPGRRGAEREGRQRDRPRRELDQRRLRLPLDGGSDEVLAAPGRRRSGPAGRRRRRQGSRGRRLVHRADRGQRATATSSSAGSTTGARSIRCSEPRASRSPPSTSSTSGRATASR